MRCSSTDPTASSFPTAPTPAVGYAINTVKNLIGKKPMFGIASAISCSARAYWRQDLQAQVRSSGPTSPFATNAGKVEITTQNHGFAVDPKTLPHVEPAHQPERQHARGDARQEAPTFSVQYTPRPPRSRTTPTISSRSFAS